MKTAWILLSTETVQNKMSKKGLTLRGRPFVFFMKKRNINNFSIIGTGMVGTAIAVILKKAGYNVTSIYDQSSPALRRASRYTGAKLCKSPLDIVQNTDVVLITTSDDKILSVCKEMGCSPDIKNKFVFHMSGAGGLDLLEPAKKAGASIASIHPLQSFSSIDQAIKNIPGSYFGVTADTKALKPAKTIIRKIGGIPIVVRTEQKPLYHAAACIASNYLVSLIHITESIYTSIGFREKDARKAFMPLIYGSLKNVEKSGCVLALTGPIARGDYTTVEKHIRAIHAKLPQYSSFYSSLGLLTLKLAREKGTLNALQAKKIKTLLKGDNNEHTKQNNP